MANKETKLKILNKLDTVTEVYNDLIESLRYVLDWGKDFNYLALYNEYQYLAEEDNLHNDEDIKEALETIYNQSIYIVGTLKRIYASYLSLGIETLIHDLVEETMFKDIDSIDIKHLCNMNDNILIQENSNNFYNLISIITSQYRFKNNKSRS